MRTEGANILGNADIRHVNQILHPHGERKNYGVVEK